MEKLYERRYPMGMLRTEGKSYFLLSTSPIASQDNWETGLMRFPVIPCERDNTNDWVKSKNEFGQPILVPGYGTAIHLLVSPNNCVIEVGFYREQEYVYSWTGEYEYVPEPTQDEPEEEWMTDDEPFGVLDDVLPPSAATDDYLNGLVEGDNE